jgi:hypothetical protein
LYNTKEFNTWKTVKIETGFIVEMRGPNMMLSWNGTHTWVGECVEGERVVGQFDHNTSIFLESSLTQVMFFAKWTNSQCISIYVEWVTISW